MTALTVCAACPDLHAGGEKLYGVHWWDFSDGWRVGEGPDGGWSAETVLTHSAPWWRASFFTPLYQELATGRAASIVTRVDYDWGETVPAPANPDAATWPDSVLGAVNQLGAYASRWIIGNEPNLTSEANGWPESHITPAGYAQIYHQVRTAIKAVRPNDEVLVAPVSPGGPAGPRWMDGKEWLGQAIDAILAIPGAGIDGFAMHAYGNPFTGASQAVAEFHNTYVAQLQAIDARDLTNVPVYLTEWNRRTATTGNLAANETVTADFIRGAFADVDTWNQTPGNHNIVSMAWFVYDKDYGGWDEYALEWWRDHGNASGHPGDLWTAYLDAAQYPAGVAGTPGLPGSGDMNIDGRTNVDDVDAFVLGLNSPDSYEATYGVPPSFCGDIDTDGDMDFDDIDGFVAILTAQAGGALEAVPEPATIVLAVVALLGWWYHAGRPPGSPSIVSGVCPDSTRRVLRVLGGRGSCRAAYSWRSSGSAGASPSPCLCTLKRPARGMTCAGHSATGRQVTRQPSEATLVPRRCGFFSSRKT